MPLSHPPFHIFSLSYLSFPLFPPTISPLSAFFLTPLTPLSSTLLFSNTTFSPHFFSFQPIFTLFISHSSFIPLSLNYLHSFTQRSLPTQSSTLSTNLLYPLNRLYRPSNHIPILSCYFLISLLTLSTHIHASLSKSSHPTFSIPSHLFLFPLTQLFTPFSYY